VTYLEDLVGTLHWLLDTPQCDPNGLNPMDLRLPWRLEVHDSNVFEADVEADPDTFIIRVSSYVWPRLEAFCALGVREEGWGERSGEKVFDYTKTEWKSVIQLARDGVAWAEIEMAIANLRASSKSSKMVAIPISMGAKDGLRRHTASAYYGFWWLVCHEAVHAWKQHYLLKEMKTKESFRQASPLLAGAEMDRTCESVADWESVKLLFAHTLNCIVEGYKTELAYVTGFGIAAAMLMLNPCRHNLWDRAGGGDPGWMRIHFITEAAKSGYWWIVRSHYPDYDWNPNSRSRRNGRGPDSLFDERCEAAQKELTLGVFDALKFARNMSDANDLYRLVEPAPFKFGEPDEWKEFQVMVMDTEVLSSRRAAAMVLNDLLPADPRFKGFALGEGSFQKMMFLAGMKR
jgi:hypothetical protein